MGKRARHFPVFYDDSGRRGQWLMGLCVLLFIIVAASAAWVATSVLREPLPARSAFCSALDQRPTAAPTEGEAGTDAASRFEGKGEILIPETNASSSDPEGGIIHRMGGGNPAIDLRTVLTFDDGPDAKFTPEILDVLKKFQVPAVFFVVGKNAEKHPDLLQRMVREGHEIGNHSFSHPDLFKVSSFREDAELALTQRIIEAETGRGTVYFRPPYGGSPDPNEPSEIVPIIRAARLGYVTVGEGIIPRDWELTVLTPGVQAAHARRPRTPEELADAVIRSRQEGHIVLLHDAGGNRALTVAALPLIITRLREMGHTFVSLSTLTGISPDAAMPPVPAQDATLVSGDRAIFTGALAVQGVFGVLLLFATFFGLLRIVFLLVLVLIQRRREKQRRFDPDYCPSVTVIMAAYNEEKVIVGSVASLLQSEHPFVDIVVVDDGSKDATLRLLRDNFGDDPRVRILHQPNSGKMAAMNRALGEATGEIIMMADADTLFVPSAIGLLARHFADPRIGAVAAAVRIGNAADNMLTRWQALEYCTCQNFDRRGFDLLNCIPVIAGAAGAVRREAIESLGGFSPDTLNEDMDLTWQLLRNGWVVVNDSEAIAYTEAPNSISSFLRQRFRWAYGTFQCLWKHRDALGRYGTLGWVALPIQWLHQVILPLLSPFVDVLMLYAICTGHGSTVALFALLMLAAEALAATVAIITGDGNPRLLLWLPVQRLGYHPFMWFVVIKAAFVALSGASVGWNKFARAGTASIGGDGARPRIVEPAPMPEAEAAMPG